MNYFRKRLFFLSFIICSTITFTSFGADIIKNLTQEGKDAIILFLNSASNKENFEGFGIDKDDEISQLAGVINLIITTLGGEFGDKDLVKLVKDLKDKAPVIELPKVTGDFPFKDTDSIQTKWNNLFDKKAYPKNAWGALALEKLGKQDKIDAVKSIIK